jgi:3-oxoacyl-[acyl-carrier protein] reductase
MVKTQTKNVLITGAGTGIGLSCASKFLAEGWNVYAHYNQSVKELKKLKGVKILQANFSNKNEANKFIEAASRLSLNALVNNAGVYDFSRDAKDRVNGVQDVFLVNTIVPTLLAEAVLEKMKSVKSGAIVNISSIGVKYGSHLNSIFYSASKSGLEAVTKTLAREGAAHNVLVNCLRVGVTDTEFHKKLGKNMEQRKQMIPLKRLAKPQEIAEFVYFLCAKNTFITAETIAVAGGE